MQPSKPRKNSGDEEIISIIKGYFPNWKMEEDPSDNSVTLQIECMDAFGNQSSKGAKIYIKSHENINFTLDSYKYRMDANTVMEWCHCEIPVFLFSVDKEQKKVYWLDCAEELRTNYKKKENKTVGFNIQKDSDLDHKESLAKVIFKVMFQEHRLPFMGTAEKIFKSFENYSKLKSSLDVGQAESIMTKEELQSLQEHCIITTTPYSFEVTNIHFHKIRAIKSVISQIDFEALVYEHGRILCDAIYEVYVELATYYKKTICELEKNYWNDFNAEFFVFVRAY